jgi:hypothetical protein
LRKNFGFGQQVLWGKFGIIYCRIKANGLFALFPSGGLVNNFVNGSPWITKDGLSFRMPRHLQRWARKLFRLELGFKFDMVDVEEDLRDWTAGTK